MVAAGHTERAWGCNAGLPRSACLAGASRFEALLLNHRRRFPDAIVLVNAPHTLLSADNRRWAARACRRSAARPDLVSLECELDEQGDKTGCFLVLRMGNRAEGAAMHMCSSQEFLMLLVLDTFEGLRLGWLGR